jgi:actin-related protein 5
LLDIADEFLKPEQLKQKRILKMHKTASVLREKRKLKQEEEKKKINELLTNNKE